MTRADIVYNLRSITGQLVTYKNAPLTEAEYEAVEEAVIAVETGMSPDAVTRRLAVLRTSNRYCRDCMWYDDEHSECLMHAHGEYAVGQEHSCGEWSGGDADG